jgi:hypothetical protein
VSGYTSTLLDGIAGLLDEADVGVFRPDEVIADPSTGIFRGVMPDSPEKAIGITAYPVADDDTTNTITGVQIRIRAGRDPDAIEDLADLVFAELHNRRKYRIGGLYVAVSWRQSQAWIGQDAQKRMELTANYYFRTVRSGAHLID